MLINFSNCTFSPWQVQSFTEYFEDDCTDAIHWMSSHNYFPGFTEGWATYVDYKLLPDDTDIYSNTLDKEVLLQKYGMIHHQVNHIYEPLTYFLANISISTTSLLQGWP